MKRCTKTMICPKTMSGKHIMIPRLFYIPKMNPWSKYLAWEYSKVDHLFCEACGIIDDIPKRKKI